MSFQGPGGQVFYRISSHWEGASRDRPPSSLALSSVRMEDYLIVLLLLLLVLVLQIITTDTILS